jgi:hypothetical protein
VYVLRTFRALWCRSVAFYRSKNEVLIRRLTFDRANAATTAGGGQLVRLALGTIGVHQLGRLTHPGRTVPWGAVSGGDAWGLLGPAPGHRNLIPARTIPDPGHGVPLPKVDRQGVRPGLRALL